MFFLVIGNGERESGSEEEGERAMESHGVDGAENGAGEEHREEIKEVMGSGEAGDVSVEAVEVVEVVEVTEKVEEKPEPEKEEEEEEDGQVVAVPIVQVSSVNEEVVEAIEGLAEEADAAVEAVVLKEMVEKSGAKESEEVIVVAVPEKISEQPSESGERLAEKISAPPMESPEDTPVAVPEKISERPSESDERLPETKSREIPGTAEVLESRSVKIFLFMVFCVIVGEFLECFGGILFRLILLRWLRIVQISGIVVGCWRFSLAPKDNIR